MIFNQRKCRMARKITPIRVTSVEYVKESCPVRSIKAVAKETIINDPVYLSKMPVCDPHELEIAIDTGKNLKQVSTNVLSKDRIGDFEAQSNINKIKEKIEAKTE